MYIFNKLSKQIAHKLITAQKKHFHTMTVFFFQRDINGW